MHGSANNGLEMFRRDMQIIICDLQHKSSLKSLGYICNNSQQYIVWVKIIIFLLCQKSLNIKIMFHEDIVYRKYIKT